MTKRMLVDATHAEETRVVVVDDKRLEEFDFETSTKKQLKGNIYLAKVTRVEPSLQAAFVEYGGNRHGFLAFNEIHPDYYRVPVADREKLLEEARGEGENGDDDDNVDTIGGDDDDDIEAANAAERRRIRQLTRRYKIQEVIKRRQILLIQVVKEERGTKGAALTTYISLPGRYCVLMPNTSRGGGISRKITNTQDRKHLKSVLGDLDLPPGMAVILRTAGMERSKAEIKRDYEYLRRTWDRIREDTLKATAPTLIHEEGNIIKRTLRDVYSREIEQMLIDGEEAYKTAKSFMKAMLPSHAKRVQPYDGKVPLFHEYRIESQLDDIHSPVVQLKSGGYIVMNPTEALVAIDVNSGRATRERNIEETALATNGEAAEEIARQLRLRDLAGLIVIDFIDMEEQRHNNQVERKLKEAMRHDRARLQVGRISPFGLLELSRQRLRPSLIEAHTQVCPTCGGSGVIRSTESTALRVLRSLEEEGLRNESRELTLHVPGQVALYILNQKRSTLTDIEARYDFEVTVLSEPELIPPDFRMERVIRDEEGEPEAVEVIRTGFAPADADAGDGERRRRRRRKRRDEVEVAETEIAAEPEAPAEAEAEVETAAGEAAAVEAEDDKGKRRRRGRRGGRRRSRKGEETVEATAETAGEETVEAAATEAVAVAETEETAEAAPEAIAEAAPDAEAIAEAAPDAEAEKPKKPRRRRTRRKKPAEGEVAAKADTAEPAAEAEIVETEPERAEEPEPASEPRRIEITVVGEEPAAEPEPEAEPERVAEPEPEPEPMAAAPGTSEDETLAPDDEPDGPKRRGWWNRLTN